MEQRKFTDRFIKLPIEVYDKKVEGITGELTSAGTTYEKMNPLDISCYWPAYADEGEESKGTNVIYKNGEKHYILLPIAEFEKRVNEHMQ